jgi:hypothetical protein
MSNDEFLYFNGIDADSGDYLTPPMTPKEIVALARGEKIDRLYSESLKKFHAINASEHAGVGAEFEGNKIESSGWGAIFAADDDEVPALKEALKPLLDWRREQATQENEARYREFVGEEGYLPDESKIDWLARHGSDYESITYGPANPDILPYYLLIVGDPEKIPFRFQYQLDVQYAVGRICFNTLEEYARYAQLVVQVEQGKIILPRQMGFFGVRNDDDKSTNLSAEYLIQPLHDKLAKQKANWKFTKTMGAEATKAQLARHLGGDLTPSLLFTASHGMGFPNGHAKQLAQQGALLCQDWPGPVNHKGPLPQDFYFAADDLSESVDLRGMIAFHFACYGAGTPRENDFEHLAARKDLNIAPHAFVSQLPLRELQRGALAVIGHVERAWGFSFMTEKSKPQINTFESTIKYLMAGDPIGFAMEDMNKRYAELSSELTNELSIKGRPPKEALVTSLWTSNNDARDYIVIGDPGVHLSTGDVETAQRPTQETITLASVASAPTSAPARPPLPTPPLRPTPPPLPTPPPAPAATLTPTPTPTPAAQGSAGPDVDFGLMENIANLKQTQAQFTTSLQELTKKLGETLATLLDSSTSAQVATYVSDDLSAVSYERGAFKGSAKLGALTRVHLKGDVEQCISLDDEAVWQKHQAMVEKVMEQRLELIKAALGVLGVLKGI